MIHSIGWVSEHLGGGKEEGGWEEGGSEEGGRERK